MNYQNHYDNLINRAKNRILDSYTETHHIIPRCMGGFDDIVNLVELTPEEHKQSIGKKNSKNLKGRSWEDIYGIDGAAQRRENLRLKRLTKLGESK